MVTYLGLRIDSGLLFLDHLKEVRKKVNKLSGKMWQVAWKEWDVRRRLIREICKCFLSLRIVICPDGVGSQRLANKTPIKHRI